MDVAYTEIKETTDLEAPLGGLAVYKEKAVNSNLYEVLEADSDTATFESQLKTLGNQKVKIFSFFSGAGFLDLGFEKSSYDIEFVNEFHKPFLEAYQHSRKVMGIREPAFGYSDISISELKSGAKFDELNQAVKACQERGFLVGFIGGPPCPDFSVGGKNKGKDGEKGALSADYINLIVKMQPDFFLFENVKGLWRTRKHREFFDQLCQKVRRAGFSTKAEVLNSLSFAVPQDRERVILLGLNRKRNQKAKELIKNFSWMFEISESDLETLEWPEKDPFAIDSVRHPTNKIRKELTVQYWFDKNDVENHPNGKHYFTPRAGLPKFEKVLEGDTDKKSYKRLHRWRYSPTAAYGNNEVHLHPYKARRLSAAEALSIQSLPKDFELPVSMTLSNMFKTIGNGVPYLMSKSIADQIYSLVSELKGQHKGA